MHLKSTLILMLILLSSISGRAQTDTLEFKLMEQSLNNGEYQVADYQSFTQKWFKHLKKFGEYPNLPVGEDGRVNFSFLIQNDALSKSELFQHSLEWLAVNQNILPNQTYNNRDDGKIVFMGSFPVQNYSCNYTGVLTIKEGKMLCEFLNLNYQHFVAGHYSGDSWTPEYTINKPLDSLYPVFKQPTEDWETIWQFFKTTNETIKSLVYSLSDYQDNYEQNNDF